MDAKPFFLVSMERKRDVHCLADFFKKDITEENYPKTGCSDSSLGFQEKFLRFSRKPKWQKIIQSFDSIWNDMM